MDKSEKKKIRKIIEKEISETQEIIIRLEDLTKPIAPDNAIGRLSRMEAINTKSVNEAALGKARRKIGKLRVALGNIEEPEFGTCYECGEKIPIGRILLMPEAIMCVSCAEELEKG
jgi:DnaK suppressor protein